MTEIGMFLNSKKGIDLWQKYCDSPSEVLIKRTMDVQAPMMRVAQLVEDCQFQIECNSKVKTLEVVEEICKDVNIIYQKTYSIFFISSRDFCVCAARFYLKNKKIVLVNHSIDYPEISPNGAVRGKVNSIFIFEPLSKNSTRILNILNVDLKGSIPRFVSNKMAETQHESFSLLRSKIEEYHNSI